MQNPRPPAIVLLTDSNCRVIHANGPARALLGTCVDQRCCDLLRTDCSPPDSDCGDYHKVGNVTANGVIGDAARSAMGENFIIVMQPHAVAGPKTEGLTTREREILKLVARGLTDLAIADLIGLQHNTVRSHMDNVRKKLQVRSRSQAVARATAAGLI